ncbi:ABC transporter permease [Actinotalea sp. K2]|uniref:ABC transporter permease n=1 Tax=Actinotalea sp. K2 TaxID=2939438 RepID=UPI00201728D2|nr:ABC transporter permease subunit [Actinotalea sp. K2]MCL3860362.1 ABC transporter permease subunit [Actinotalea sp. K2]
MTEVLQAALVWFNDPANWTGSRGILARTGEHLTMSVLAVLLASLVALPLGVWLGHRRRGGTLTVLVANASRALPTFALLLIFASTSLGFGNRPAVLATAIFAIPPILTNTHTGLLEVDAAARDAARGMGMTGLRSLAQVEIPLALPMIAAGLRTAAVQVVATVTLAALVGGGGLGVYIVVGLGTRRFGEVLAGALLVAALCLIAEGVLGLTQRLMTPEAMRRYATGQADPDRSSSRV